MGPQFQEHSFDCGLRTLGSLPGALWQAKDTGFTAYIPKMPRKLLFFLFLYTYLTFFVITLL
jgi:hypothetical protein